MFVWGWTRVWLQVLFHDNGTVVLLHTSQPSWRGQPAAHVEVRAPPPRQLGEGRRGCVGLCCVSQKQAKPACW